MFKGYDVMASAAIIRGLLTQKLAYLRSHKPLVSLPWDPWHCTAAPAWFRRFDLEVPPVLGVE